MERAAREASPSPDLWAAVERGRACLGAWYVLSDLPGTLTILVATPSLNFLAYGESTCVSDGTRTTDTVNGG